MSRYCLFNRESLCLKAIETRGSDIFARRLVENGLRFPIQPRRDISSIAAAVSSATTIDRARVVMCGGHVIKLGLSKFVIELIERGFVSCIATNGAGLIHDFELALCGETSEDVAKWIKVGQFGLWQETARLNDVAVEAANRGEGFGEAVGRTIEEEQFPYRDISIAAAAYRCGIPVTCHVSIGCDIFHGYPNASGAALGAVSHTDFLIFARKIQNLEGGVFLNIGSAVTGPEVYLKALSMARNVARQKGEEIRNFTTAVFDVVDLPDNWRDGPGARPQGPDGGSRTVHPLYYFRPWKTILCRTVEDGGQSYYVRGDHRETIPALWHALVHGEKCEASDEMPERVNDAASEVTRDRL